MCRKKIVLQTKSTLLMFLLLGNQAVNCHMEIRRFTQIRSVASPARRLGAVPPAVARIVDRGLGKISRMPMKTRWALTGIMLLVYFIRQWIKRGFEYVSYGLSIYLSNLMVRFMRSNEQPGMNLPKTSADLFSRGAGFNKFSKKMQLPEFQVWLNSVIAIGLAIWATFLSYLDLPVWYPIVVLYFVASAANTLQDVIKKAVKRAFSQGPRRM
eukprot:gnl/MRDRNA2_/MRDRNA2_116093_c0_seq1.p1 gnl/MRDRNA2_/MRDRNA2_116093_c0~~gnl/MRDRNA2_/MRDRNA2_116093_c0_seq1.p1  ORF type:complete len:212 (-),score=12.91 gnl/MRDRNA2_/MRDRNA2_116093_c0_seq1:8-643(-)